MNGVSDRARRSEASRRPEALERERLLVESLSRLAHAVARFHDLRPIVQLVTDEATALTGAQFGAFFYNAVRRESNTYSLYVISGASIADFERFPMPRPTEIFRPTFEGRATVRIADVHADPRYGRNSPYHGLPPGHLPVRSYLAVPVFAPDGAVIGGLFFGHEDVGVFGEDDERVVAAIAEQAAGAIDKAQLIAAERAARAEAEARANAALALDHVDDGIVMVDNEGFVRLWNRAAVRATGLPTDAVVGRSIGEAVPGWERIVLDIPVGRPDENVTAVTLPLDTLDGHERWLSLYGVGFGAGTVYAFRDVTQEHALETLRTDMIATLSHELRTPVASVYGAVKTLAERALEPEVVRDLLSVAENESERLARLVDDILTTSQIESGSLSVAAEAFDPLAAVAAAVEATRARGASVSTVAPSTVAAACGDEQKVHQVLINLIDNAVKYGGERVTIRVVQALDQIRFEVCDDGPGIADREQQKIFEKFYRLDPQHRQGPTGTGLGLYICRELVRRMDGRIGVVSEPGAGATFWFQLPRA